MMRRLDALDRSISEEREASKADAARMIDEIEARLTTARQPVAPEMIAGRIADIERKMGEIAGQLDTPRPLGRRGRPLATEVRDAVAEVRRRQRELEEGIAEWNAASAGELKDGPQDGPAALAVTPAEEGSGQEPSPAIAELQRETNRLRDALGSLATGRDVSELERTMQAVASDLQRARAPQELAAIAAPVELMRLQVERIAEDVADNVHARIAGEVERLAGKVDAVLSGVLSGPADQSALDGVFRELDEIRRLVASLAGPERIQSLAQGVQAISAQITQLQRDEDAGIATLKPLLEEIRGELKAPDSSRELPGALLGRFEPLAQRLDGAESGSVGELIERLEGVAEKSTASARAAAGSTPWSATSSPWRAGSKRRATPIRPWRASSGPWATCSPRSRPCGMEPIWRPPSRRRSVRPWRARPPRSRPAVVSSCCGPISPRCGPTRRARTSASNRRWKASSRC